MRHTEPTAYSWLPRWMRGGSDDRKPSREEDDLAVPADEDGDTAEEETRHELGGVVTDQRLLQFYYKKHLDRDVQPVTTDRFLDRSRSQYNPPWLAREIVQNFVDHNPGERKGTLNGVRFTEEKIPKRDDMPRGGKRFTISGNWKFDDLTGITSFHSDKPDVGKSAGGNGIGLKQTVLRFLRDFGVQKFQVAGEGWEVDYFLAKKQEVNEGLRTHLARTHASPAGEVRHDWLLADVQKSRNKGNATYVIETDNEEVITALREFPNLGVLEGNEFLQEMDYTNARGSLKWLAPNSRTKEPRGRLYINGQVMNYKEKGKTPDDYWRGPEFVTLVLKDVDYEMSVDRPPLDSYQLDSYLDAFVNEMRTPNLVAQLQASESIWSSQLDETWGSTRSGAMVVVKKMVSRLSWQRDYRKETFQALFPGKKYLAWDDRITRHQADELRERGFVLCSDYFEQIGMPKATSELSSVEAASTQTPTSAQFELEKIARETGLPVFAEELEAKSADQLFTLLGERLQTARPLTEEVSGKPHTFRMRFDTAIPKELLFHQLPRPKKDKADQQLLHLLRSFIFTGLKSGVLQKAFTGQGDYVTTYATDFDTVTLDQGLIIRNVEAPNNDGVFLEVEVSEGVVAAFRQTFIETGGRASGVSDRTSPEDALAIARTKAHIESLPVDAPAGPIQPPGPAPREVRVETKATVLSAAEEARLASIADRLPEIRTAIVQLTRIADAHPSTTESATGTSPAQQYFDWKRSDNFYGQLETRAGYLTPQHLIDILNQRSAADIAVTESSRRLNPVEQEMHRLNAELKAVANKLKPLGDRVDEFEIVLEPTERQLSQLGLLKVYAELSTGTALPNDLFIYQGTGSRGINIGQRAIGLHEALFRVSFGEALSTFTHEIAHNVAMNHGPQFMHTMQSLFVEMIYKSNRIAQKLKTRATLTTEEEALLDIENEWEGMQQAA